jgi:hypothetical protein
VSVRIYVEGGGDQRATLAECRRGFSEFFKKIVPAGSQPRIIPCGSREVTFDAFKTALVQHRDEFVILLVDSEALVQATGPWSHLKARDNWDQPTTATNDHAHLMVQCMETWFLADVDTLARYYGQGFNRNPLPRRRLIEQVPKAQVEDGLTRATQHTQKGEYHKTRHGFDLLSKIDAKQVRADSPHAERLCVVLIRESGS